VNQVARALSLGVCVNLALLSLSPSLAVEPRFPHFVCADPPDSVRQWANLEGKSDTMRDDLYREHSTVVEAPAQKKEFWFTSLFELAFVGLELWWNRRS
jgi:hypothetical protein